jgi:hypothetical protein
MKYHRFIIALLFSATLTFFVAAQSHKHERSTTQMKPDTTLIKKAKNNIAEDKYTCSMHSEVISDKPGKCPKCGMTLVKVKPEIKTGKTDRKHKNTTRNVPAEQK